MKKVKVYCGESIYDLKNISEHHPVTNVKIAEYIILSDKDETIFTNSSDFISAIKYIGLKHKVETEFFLNKISCGNDIEPIFADLNRALDLIIELGETIE
jgi:hypothetical protein